jgi:hypothetical protein
VHQPGGRGSDAAKPEDSAEPAREHAVFRMNKKFVPDIGKAPKQSSGVIN